MQRILLRAGYSPLEVVSPVAAVEHYPGGVFGGNIGNMIFSDAVHRMLSRPGVDVIPNGYLGERQGVTPEYLDRINAQFDHFVVPLANAFRPAFLTNLEVLTSTIGGLRIPVTVTGVGIGGDMENLSSGEVKRVAQRFMAAVLDRSARVGVRGEITRQFLRTIGFDDAHVQVIGCPSLFRYGADLQIDKPEKPLTNDDPIAINMPQVTGLVREMDELAELHAARYSKLTYVAQNHVDLRRLLAGDEEVGTDPSLLRRDRPFYDDDRMLSFVDSRSWIDFLSSVRFAFGTRIHGNIAALLAGTPAVIIAWDLRTQEIADYHEIPRRGPTGAAELDAAELYDAADFSLFNKRHPERFATFQSFLRDNNLKTVFDPGEANPSYDQRLAALPLAGPILPVRNPRRRNGLLNRLSRRWHNTAYHFTARVPHVPASVAASVVAVIARKLHRSSVHGGQVSRSSGAAAKPS